MIRKKARKKEEKDKQRIKHGEGKPQEEEKRPRTLNPTKLFLHTPTPPIKP